MMTRRDALKKTALSAAVVSAAALPDPLKAQAAGVPAGPFKLPALPYAFDALEPHIDAKTMEIHYSKHHQAYVDNLNKALAKSPEWLGKSIVEVVRDYKKLPMEIQTAVRNNGGGHLNHTWFWQMMAPKGGAPKGELLKAIDDSFGSLDKFKDEFKAAALGQFGSGWAWLVKGKEKPLAVVKTANQDNPVTDGTTVLLGCDVWEHAYYLKYQNKRPDYLDAWWNVVNWSKAGELFDAAKG
jgi:Fe-Mn family superoxide dismutase